MTNALSAANVNISPDGQTALTINVTKDGEPVADANVKVEVQVTGGGHEHNDVNRPRGCLVYNGSESLLTADDPSIDVTTDSSGKAVVLFKPGKDITQGCQGRGIAGNYEVTARLTDSPSTIDRQTVVAEVEGLQPLPLTYYGANYVITGQTSAHPTNNWATPTTNRKILALAADFRDAQDKLNAVLEGCGKPTWSIQQLSVNDMSLPGGGLFDVGGTPWQPPHKAHRQGYSVDFNRWDYPDDSLQFACEHDRTISQRWWLLSALVSLGRKYGIWSPSELAERPPRYHLEIGQSNLSSAYPRMQSAGPDLSVTLLAMAPEYLVLAPGQIVTYAIGVNNMDGTGDANSAVLSVTLPADLSLALTYLTQTNICVII